MRNIVLVIKHEIRRTVGKPSFWLTAFLFPLIIFTITFGSQLLASGMSNGNSGSDFLGTISGQTPSTEQPRGYVDLAGVIKRMPEGLPAGLLRPYADEASAQDATARGEISQYYVVPPDFLSTGDIVLVQGTFSPFEALGSGNIFEYVVTYNLTGNADTAALLLDPTPTVHVVTQSSPETGSAGAGGQTGAVGSIASMGMLFIFFFVLTMSSGFMLRSVTKEKESRVVEILLSSLDPRELMLGKIIGLGAVGLLQMVIWLGGGMLILREGSPVFGIASAVVALDFPPGFLLWALLYFLLGYMTFASALGAIGTLGAHRARGGPVHVPGIVSPDGPDLAQHGFHAGARGGPRHLPEHLSSDVARLDDRPVGGGAGAVVAAGIEPRPDGGHHVRVRGVVRAVLQGRYLALLGAPGFQAPSDRGAAAIHAVGSARSDSPRPTRFAVGRASCYNPAREPFSAPGRLVSEAACVN